MGTVAEALVAVALVVALGLGLRRTGAVPVADWAPVERLVYFVLFPALLFLELARADLAGSGVGRMALALMGAQLALFALAWAARAVFRLDGPRFGCLAQGVVRWNSYTALAVAPLLLGPQGFALAAVAVGALTPMANLLSVWVLIRHGGRAAARLEVLGGLLRNPLLLACLAGLAWNLAGLPLPRLLVEPLAILGRATLALGLMAVGAALEPVARGQATGVIALAAVGRLVLEPLVAIGLAKLLGVEGPALVVVALCGGVPTASSAYILARLLGGDAPLTAAIVTVTTVLAILTLPIMLALVL